MKKSISTQQTKENIAAVLEILASSSVRLEQMSASLPPERFLIPLGDGARTATEELAHLINSEARFSESIYLALLTVEPLILDLYSEQVWGKLLRFDLLPFADLVQYFKIRRTVLMRVLNELSDAQWARVVREENKQRKESVYWRARALALHELDHVSDLERKLGT